MFRTALLLIVTVIVLPVVTFKLAPYTFTPGQIHMLKVSGMVMLFIGLTCFTLAELTQNCSQVDKIWSITPVIYAWYFAHASGWDHRVVLMAVCATIWGIRLTYNFSRRGAYRLKFWEGEEDYRWEVVRDNPAFKGHPWRFRIFNLLFISLYQNTLLWLFTLPAVMAYSRVRTPLMWADYLIATIYVALVIIEATADQQQWNYQNEKHRKIKAGESLGADPGFVSTGLWSKVRHPNYACEQAIWVTFYFFSVIPEGRWVNWSMAGCLLLLVLFKASADFSEGISLGKYPKYKDYIATVPRFIPKFW